MGNINQPPSTAQPKIKLGDIQNPFKGIATLATPRDRPTVILPPRDTTVYSGSLSGQHG